jgi:hypothetical protein
VAVNRLWQHHFGRGLVRTPDNFGSKGEKPTHPGLLDWLASELIDGGWNTKRLHRLILLSETYRQASLHPREAEYGERDFDNALAWRVNRRRLDAEALREGPGSPMCRPRREARGTCLGRGAPGPRPRRRRSTMPSWLASAGSWRPPSQVTSQVTSTWNIQDAALPDASVAVQKTNVVPMGKVLPGGGT